MPNMAALINRAAHNTRRYRGLWLAGGAAQPWLQQESLMRGFRVLMHAFETL
jgi:hypothetical protein